jgi:hypothetical protein
LSGKYPGIEADKLLEEFWKHGRVLVTRDILDNSSFKPGKFYPMVAGAGPDGAPENAILQPYSSHAPAMLQPYSYFHSP